MTEPRAVRALMVFHIGGVGGPQRSFGGVIAQLREHGSIEFMVPEAGPTADDFAAFGPVTVAPYEALVYARGLRAGVELARRQGREVRMFRRELRRRRPDLVIAVTTVLPALLLAARLERVPTIVYAAEVYRQSWKGSPLLALWGALLSGVTEALSNGIVCCSDVVARQFGRTRKPLSVSYPPVGTEYGEGSREHGRELLGARADEVVMAVVGSVSRGRGQDDAIRALAALRARDPRLRLAIVGAPHSRAADLAYADELHELVRELGVGDAVTFAGASGRTFGPAEMADVYAGSDIVVNPARFEEPFGRVAPEALIAGRPVVATRVGAIPEVIRDGEDGLLVSRDDPEALAGAIGKLLDDPALGERLVERGRQRVLERFGAEQDMAAWSRVVDQVASVGLG